MLIKKLIKHTSSVSTVWANDPLNSKHAYWRDLSLTRVQFTSAQYFSLTRLLCRATIHVAHLLTTLSRPSYKLSEICYFTHCFLAFGNNLIAFKYITYNQINK